MCKFYGGVKFFGTLCAEHFGKYLCTCLDTCLLFLHRSQSHSKYQMALCWSCLNKISVNTIKENLRKQGWQHSKKRSSETVAQTMIKNCRYQSWISRNFVEIFAFERYISNVMPNYYKLYKVKSNMTTFISINTIIYDKA